MTYAVCLELTNGEIIANNYVTGADTAAEVEDEITYGEEFVVSNSRKHVRVRRSDVVALLIELQEE